MKECPLLKKVDVEADVRATSLAGHLRRCLVTLSVSYTARERTNQPQASIDRRPTDAIGPLASLMLTVAPERVNHALQRVTYGDLLNSTDPDHSSSLPATQVFLSRSLGTYRAMHPPPATARAPMSSGAHGRRSRDE